MLNYRLTTPYPLGTHFDRVTKRRWHTQIGLKTESIFVRSNDLTNIGIT